MMKATSLILVPVRPHLVPLSRTMSAIAVAMTVFWAAPARAVDMSVESIRLPVLRIDGKAVTAHKQGLDWVDGQLFVTAQRDDVRPKRALLLRVVPAATNWVAWDITPAGRAGAGTGRDHPGGFQTDGTRLWIPVAESKPHGRSVIRAYRVTDLTAGRRPEAEFEFEVEDHIGAVAVSVERQLLLGANWDTETVYAWDFNGRSLWTLAGVALKERGLGFVAGAGGRAGIAVQDWKLVGDQLYVSGLFRSPGTASVPPASRWCWFDHFSAHTALPSTVTLPLQDGVELAKEAMAIAGDKVYFLPEDLKATNRLFWISLTALTH